MSDDWFVRWGWTLSAVCLVLAALNVWVIAAFDGGPLNWAAIGMLVFSGSWAAVAWLEEARR